MTVLTFPSAGGKPDKAPLIGDEQANRPGQTQPPPYHPGSLETGDGGVPHGHRPKICVHGASEHRRVLRKMVKIAVVVLAFLLSLYFVVDALCKSYVEDVHHKQQQQQLDAEDDAAVPCKSYTSYAAAENDMLSLPPPPPPSPQPPQPPGGAKNLIISLVINPVNGAVADQAPPVVINKSARFIHDFSVNITGIVDLESQRCFVMPLIRSSVEPPESLYDMLIKMSSGYYSSDINKILRNYRLVKPALADLSDYGIYISRDCAYYPTFKLEKDAVAESP